MATRTDYLASFARKRRDHGSTTLQNLRNPEQPEPVLPPAPPETPYKTYETPAEGTSWLSDRWGPGLDDSEPGLVVYHDWRSFVAAWPHDRWTRWRRMVDQLVSREPNPTAETIRAADRVAYDVIRMEDETFIVTAK
jgi:hypothetical protein